jgi:hypothetical protein
MLAEVSDKSSKNYKPVHHTGFKVSSTTHNIMVSFGWEKYEFEVYDYLVIFIGVWVLIGLIVFVCVCFPPYKSEEEWAEIEDERDAREQESEKRKKKEKEEAAKDDMEAAMEEGGEEER